MNWHDIRNQYPDQWLLIEAVEAHSQENQRILDKLAVVNLYKDSSSAMKAYQELHHAAPDRELYVVHTSRETLDIRERRWLGIRGVS